jgi:uncharacterized protein YegL
MSAFSNINCVYEVHTKPMEEFPLKLFDEEIQYKNFGIISLSTGRTEPIQVPLAIFFNVDYSASMSDTCSDGGSKMQYIIHTLNNILRVFSDMENIECYIAVDTFDNDIKTIFDFTKITSTNLNTYTEMISKIYPNGSTDIEKSLINAKTKINNYIEKNPTHKIVHIQLTDGDATAGCNDPKILAETVDERYTNIFIGFGNTHNSIMLNTLADKKYGEYLFIDKIENAGLVYGEIVNNLIYSLMEDGYIEVENCEIYDWKKNIWCNKLILPKIAADTNKTYHIRYSDVEVVNIYLYGKLINNNQIELLCNAEKLPDLVHFNTNRVDENDLTQYMYRQKVQELLHSINEYNATELDRKEYSYSGFTDTFSSPVAENVNDKKNEIRKNVKTLFNHLEKYRNEFNEKKQFIKVLMDDLYVSYKTMDTHRSHMYSCARQTSQGRQYSYNVTNIEEEVKNFKIKRSFGRFNVKQTPLKRNKNILCQCLDTNDDADVPDANNDDTDSLFVQHINKKLEFENEYDEIFREHDIDENCDEFDDFVLSQNTETTYTSPSIVNMMRTVSQR